MQYVIMGSKNSIVKVCNKEHNKYNKKHFLEDNDDRFKKIWFYRKIYE